MPSAALERRAGLRRRGGGRPRSGRRLGSRSSRGGGAPRRNGSGAGSAATSTASSRTALARDPARRYASAGQLLADVERHLAGLPVEARGPSLRYRAASFVRRHRVGVAAAAAVVLSLFGGLGAALWQAGRAARERDEARIERARAEQVAGFVLGLFAAADPFTPERLDTLRARDLVDARRRARAHRAGRPAGGAGADARHAGRGLHEPGALRGGAGAAGRGARAITVVVRPACASARRC